MRRELVILRGLPGSGKSTRAAQLGGVVVCHDDVLPEDRDALTFEEWKAVKVVAVQKVRKAMRQGSTPIVVDNCHVTQRSYQDYVNAAEQHGYSVRVEQMHGQPDEGLARECFKRTTHMTPLEVVLDMAARWEDPPGSIIGKS